MEGPLYNFIMHTNSKSSISTGQQAEFGKIPITKIKFKEKGTSKRRKQAAAKARNSQRNTT